MSESTVQELGLFVITNYLTKAVYGPSSDPVKPIFPAGEVCPGMQGESSEPILKRFSELFTVMLQLCMPYYEKICDSIYSF